MARLSALVTSFKEFVQFVQFVANSPKNLNTEIIHKDLSYAIVGAAMEVHRVLGRGFLESVYQKALEHEFSLRSIPFEAQKKLPVQYKDISIGEYIADFLVGDQVIVEIKAISALDKVHEAQAHHYLAATGLELAILLNFGAASLQQKRIVRKTISTA